MLDPHRKIERGFEAACQVSDRVSETLENFLLKIAASETRNFNAASYMQAAVMVLQQQDEWKRPARQLLEAEDLNQTHLSAGTTRRQDLQGWNKGGHLWWTDAAPQDSLTLEMPIPAAGRYQLLARFTKAPDYGIVSVSVNDQPAIEALDLYAPQVERGSEIALGFFDFSLGNQRLTIKIVGQNEQAVPRHMVGLDYLVLQTEPPAAPSAAAREIQEALCEQFVLDPAQLRRWIAAIEDPATTATDHPGYLLRQSAESTVDLHSDEADAFYSPLFQQLRDSQESWQRWYETDSVNAAAVQLSSIDDWDRQGFAFLRDVANPQFHPLDANPVWCGDWNPMHSGRLGPKFQGVLRSPTFEIQHPHLYYHVFARNAQIRLIIDGFRLDVNNALLFNGMNLTVDTGGKWQWVQQAGDLKNYIGHRAFIEIIDQGDGFIAVDQIRATDMDPTRAVPPPLPASLQTLLADVEAGSWHDARFNQGWTPLQRVCQSLANAMQPHTLVSNNPLTVRDGTLFNWMLQHRLFPDQAYDELEASLREARLRLSKINDDLPAPELALGMVDGSPENEYVFIRGNHRNLGSQVPRSPIQALHDANRWNRDLQSSGRLELAENMVSPEHPLTRRVIVNRIWHHLTGRGLVESVDNFGVLGKRPTHPELLDYLATEFSRQGWSIKQMIRRIVLSQTYRMSSSHPQVASQTDPNNELLYKFRLRRIPGEAIRDSILAISGQLDSTMYGPSVPIHLTEFMQGRGRPGASGPLDGQGRRSIYIEVRRNFLSPMMLAFDTPIPFNAIGQRNNSNVPAQALIMMNDPFVLDQAGKWARRLIDQEPDPSARTQRAFLAALGRPATSQEFEEIALFLETQKQAYGTDVNEQQLWTDVCHIVFNLKEFIYVK